MTKKRTSGLEEGKENVLKVEEWIFKRNQLRDWDEYKSRGRINRSLLAEDLGFARSVTTQNPGVRSLLEQQDKIWFNSEPVTIAAQEASIERTQGKLRTASSDNNKLLARVAELEAENRELQKKLTSFQRIQSLIEAGEPGFKV